MDKTTATEAIQAADHAAKKASEQGGISVPLFVFLGFLEAGVVMVQVLAPGRRGITLFLLAVIPLLIANLYLATRPTTPRFSRTTNPILLACATAFVTVVFTFGRGFFPESYVWWIIGGIVSGLPLLAIALIEVRRRKQQSPRLTDADV